MRTVKFKSSEVGPIPVEWEVKRIGDLYDVGSSKRVFQAEWRSNGIPFYRARDLVGFRRGEDAIGGLFIDSGLYAQYKKAYGVPRLEDLLVTAVGTLGVAYRVTNESPFYFKDGNIIWFRSKDLYSSRLLETLFSSGYLDSQIYDTAGGSTVGTYTITNAKKTLIPIPPRLEQERIAEALSDVDALLSAMTTLIEKKRAIKQGAMQQLLTGKKRLAGFTGPWVEKRLGEIMKDELYGVGAEAIPYNHKVKYIRITDIDEDSHKFVPSPLVSPAFYSSYHVVKENDILVARTGASVGKSYIYDPCDGRLVLAGFLMRFNVINANAKFVFYQTLSQNYQEWVVSESMRTGQPGLNLEQLKSFEFLLPPTLAEQKAIAAVLSDMDAELAALESKRAKYESVKQGMMQELLTGKTRLV